MRSASLHLPNRPTTPSAPPLYRPRKGPLAETSKQAVAFHARAQQAREAAVHLPALADLQVMMCSCCRLLLPPAEDQPAGMLAG